MSAYMIAQIEVTDSEAFKAYAVAVPKTIEQYGGQYLVRGGETMALEGEPLKRVVILCFEDMAAAHRWYHSPEYQAIIPLRQAASTGSLTLVQGV